MSALRWRQSGPDSRTADGRYSKEWYELRRERTNAGTWWTAWFYDGLLSDDGSEYPPQRIGYGNFVQVRAAAIRHYNTPVA